MKYLVDNINNYSDEEIASFFEHIYDSKKQRLQKMSDINHLKQSIVGELLLKELLETDNINYGSLKFKVNYYGKPHIKNSFIFFNISHSFDYVLCATAANEIGVDIEKIREININDIHIFATDNEQKYILKSKKKIYERAFEIYTLKEAYYKLLNHNLEKVKNTEFIVNKDNIICSDKNVKCKLVKKFPNYIIAICERKNYTNV